MKFESKNSKIEPKTKYEAIENKRKSKGTVDDPINSMNFFKRLKLIKGTLSKLRERTSFRKLKFVKNHQLKIIHDYTCDGEGRQDIDFLISYKPKKNTGIHWFMNSLVNSYNSLKKIGKVKGRRLIRDVIEEGLQRTIPTIKPNSKKKILWDFFIMFFIIFKFFMIPIELCFGIKLHINVDPVFGLLNFITSCFFIIDIFLKMNTGFYENGNVILIKSKILKHYFKSYFILDMLASVHSGKYIYEYIYTLSSQNVVSSAPWLHIFFFFKLIELMHIVSNLEESIYMSETVEALVELLKLIVKIVLYSHLEACIWHATAYYNKSSGDNWIKHVGMSEDHWFDRYLVSLFWSVSSLITASYGEKVSPQNRLEMMIGVFLLLFGAMVFGYTIKSVGEVLDRLNKSKRNFKIKLRTLNRFMKQKKIDYELQDRARKYLHFFLRDRESENSKRVEEILEKFSFKLKEEIYLNTNGVILQKFPVLNENFSNEFLKKLVFRMTHVSFIPEELIFQEHSLDNQNLYLITEGQIQIYHDNTKRMTLLKQMTAGNSFGEKEFFSGSARTFSAKSLTFSSGYCIKREDFIKTLEDFPEDYEWFCMIKDEILIYNDIANLKQRCFSCNMIGHDYTQCRKIKYIPFKDFIISRSQHSKPQDRDAGFNRKRTKKFNSRLQNRAVVTQVQEFLMNASFIYSESLTLTEDIEEGFEGSEIFESLGDQDEIVLKSPGKILAQKFTNRFSKKISHYTIDENNFDSDFSINNESSVSANMNMIKNKAPKKLDDLIAIKEPGNHELKINTPELEKKDNFSGKDASEKCTSEKSNYDDTKSEKKIQDKQPRKSSIMNNLTHNDKIFTFENIKVPVKNVSAEKRSSKLGNIFFPLNILEKGLGTNENFTRKETQNTSTRKEKRNTINNQHFEGTKGYQKTSSIANFCPVSVNARKDDTHTVRTTTDTRNKSKTKFNLEEGLIKAENLFILEFDRVKSYSKYFKTNNLENVMKEIEAKEKLVKKKKLKLRLSHRSLKNPEDLSPAALRFKLKKKKDKSSSNESISTPKKEKIKIYEILH